MFAYYTGIMLVSSMYILCQELPYIVSCLRWKSLAIVELNCNLLENIHGCMVVLCTKLYCIVHHQYFIGKVLQLLIGLLKPQNFSISNDLQ